MKQQVMIWALVVSAFPGPLPGVVQAQAPACPYSAVKVVAPLQSYSAWEEDANTPGRWQCYYFYRLAGPGFRYGCQICVWENNGAASHWIYYYNVNKQAYWGKCASPLNPAFNANQAHWSLSKNGGKTWTRVIASAPPVPEAAGETVVLSPPAPPTP